MNGDDAVRDEAAAWLARRDRGLTEEESRRMREWAAGDPRNARELERLVADWARFDQAGKSPELVRMAREVGRRRPPAARRARLFGFWAAGLAAAAAAIVTVNWIRMRPAAPAAPAVARTYRVVPAAARTLRLSDGSVVDVRTGGDVATDFTPALRRVVLARGEAHFAVARNPARPFIVAAGAVAVRAVGTAFDVRRRPGAVDVLVTEGKVTIEDGRAGGRASAPLLAAGKRAEIALDVSGAIAGISIDSPSPADVERELAWRSTWFVFDRTPLGSAVEAFNRRGPPRLVMGDESLRGRLLGGTFRADNVDGFVRLLRDSVDVRSERGPGGEIVLLPAR